MDDEESGGQAEFDAYVEALIGVIGHADRAEPLRDYCLGLMMPVARKSVEPLAAVTAPARVSAKHQSLLHFVGRSPWSDAALIALDQVRAALAAGTPAGVILAEAGYGADGAFRSGLSDLGLDYVVGVQPTLSVWRPGEAPPPPKAWSGTGRPPSLMRRSRDHKPLSARALAQELPPDVWRNVTWREGTNVDLTSRFAAVRVRPASRDYNLARPCAEEWLLIEWPAGDAEPHKYWLSTLPADMLPRDLVATTKLRWRIERDYRELKQELGLGHYEGRGWRGFHHHASLCIVAYGFLLSERKAIPPSAPTRLEDGEVSLVPHRSRPHPSAGPTRAARPQFDHHHTPKDHRRPRSQPAPMSLLRKNQRPSSNHLVTQLEAVSKGV